MLYFSISQMEFNEKHKQQEQSIVSGEGASRPSANAEGAKRERIVELHSIINNHAFLAYSQMLLAVAQILQEVETLAWTCPCHPERRGVMLQNLMHEGRRKVIKKCCMAGRIGPCWQYPR